jgi:hypothetical protein
MEIKGKLIQLLPLQTGEGKNGPWKKQDIIVEQQGQIPKKACVSIWGDKINIGQWPIGTSLTLQIDVESREFNGRWYTDLKAWKIEAAGASPSSDSFSDPEPPFVSQDREDDLPF